MRRVSAWLSVALLVGLLSLLCGSGATVSAETPAQASTDPVSLAPVMDELAVAAALEGMSLKAKSPTVHMPGITDKRWKKVPKNKRQGVLDAAQQAAGTAVCVKLSFYSHWPSSWQRKCVSVTGNLYTATAGAVSAGVCTVLSKIPVIGGKVQAHCAGILAGLMMGEGMKAFQGAASTRIGKVLTTTWKVAKFVANPADGWDSLANKAKEWAAGLIKSVLTNITAYDSTSLGSKAFRINYARAAGIGVALFAVMLMYTCVQSARGEIEPEELAESVMLRGPVTVLLLTFGPALGYVLQTAVQGLSEGIAAVSGESMATFISKTFVPLLEVTVVNLPGGVLTGIALFGVMGFGAISLIIVLIMQNFGLFMISCVFALSAAMRINPVWRPKVKKVEAGFGSALLFKPLLLLLLGIAFGFLNMTIGTGHKSGFGLLMELATIGAVLLAVGLAPVLVVRHAPILPGGGSGSGGISGGGAMLAGAAGGAMSQVAMQRAQAGGGQASNGSGGRSSGKPGEGGSASTSTSSSDGRGPSTQAWQQRSAAPEPGKGPGPVRQPAAQAGKGAAGKGAAAAGKAGSTASGVGLALSAGSQVGQAAMAHSRKLHDDSTHEMREGEGS